VAGELWRLGAAETAAAIRERRHSCEEVVASHVERMRSVNPPLNAVTVDLGDEAIDAARAADAALDTGAAPGPLCGVPVTIKENVDVTGQPTPNGLPALANLVAPDDSPVVKNLKQAGAIIIGRTNTPEFSFRAFTDNPLRGLTLNPWDEAVTCGGSSGGAGAAAAAGIACINHGNDIGGSLRFPAHQCGLSTIRPTLGRVPSFNPSASDERPPLMTLMSVQGPITRCVADTRLGLEVMAQGDPHDPWWVPAPLVGPPLDAPIKVAVTTEDYGVGIDPQVRASVGRAADILSDAGYAVEEAALPNVADTLDLWFNLLFTEFSGLLEQGARPLFSETMAGVIDAYKERAELQDHAGYMRGLAQRNAMLREWGLFHEQYPLVLTPTLLGPPLRVGDDEGGYDSVKRVFESATYVSSMNLLGLPVGIAPIGMHDTSPISVQLIGPRYREDLCLDAAAVIEAEVGILVEELWAR
jgi:amidase